jgi:hypothetical protein
MPQLNTVQLDEAYSKMRGLRNGDLPFFAPHLVSRTDPSLSLQYRFTYETLTVSPNPDSNPDPNPDLNLDPNLDYC